MPADTDKPSKTHGDSHDSRVVPVARLRPVRPVAVFFVLLNALLAAFELPPVINLLTLLPFALILTVVVVHRFDAAGLPGSLGRLAQGFVDQVRERPLELWLLVGSVALSCGQVYVVPPMWLILAYPLTMSLALLIRGTEVGGSAYGWQHLVQTGKMRVVRADEPRPDADMRPVIDSERDRKTWEVRQHRRWEEWMREEVQRLDDDEPS